MTTIQESARGAPKPPFHGPRRIIGVQPPLAPTPLIDPPFSEWDQPESELPVREYLSGTFSQRGTVEILGAPPGIGKSTVTTTLAAGCALGIIDGVQDQAARLCVLIVALEDPIDEVKRRVIASTKHFGIQASELNGHLYVIAGQSLNLAAQSDNGIEASDQAEELINLIREKGIDLVYIDTLAEAHGLEENANSAMVKLTGIVRQIAVKGDCVVRLVHHTAKNVEAQGHMHGLRGASALAGSARAIHMILPVGVEEGSRLDIDPRHVSQCIKLVTVKSNYAPPTSPTYYHKQSVELANGDQAPVAVTVRLKAEAEAEAEVQDDAASAERLHLDALTIATALNDQPNNQMSLNKLAIAATRIEGGAFADYAGKEVNGTAARPVLRRIEELVRQGYIFDYSPHRGRFVIDEGKPRMIRYQPMEPEQTEQPRAHEGETDAA